MNSLDKINDIKAKDLFDILIIEKGLRAVDLKFYKKHDLMIVFLNTGKTEQLNISEFPELAKATERKLKQYKLVHKGIGFEWRSLNFDLSLKGFLKKAALNTALKKYQIEENKIFA